RGGDHAVAVAIGAHHVGDLGHAGLEAEGAVGHEHVAVAVHRGAAGAGAVVGRVVHAGVGAGHGVPGTRARVARHLAPGAGVDLAYRAVAAVGDPGEGRLHRGGVEHEAPPGILGDAAAGGGVGIEAAGQHRAGTAVAARGAAEEAVVVDAVAVLIRAVAELLR